MNFVLCAHSFIARARSIGRLVRSFDDDQTSYSIKRIISFLLFFVSLFWMYSLIGSRHRQNDRPTRKMGCTVFVLLPENVHRVCETHFLQRNAKIAGMRITFSSISLRFFVLNGIPQTLLGKLHIVYSRTRCFGSRFSQTIGWTSVFEFWNIQIYPHQWRERDCSELVCSYSSGSDCLTT